MKSRNSWRRYPAFIISFKKLYGSIACRYFCTIVPVVYCKVIGGGLTSYSNFTQKAK